MSSVGSGSPNSAIRSAANRSASSPDTYPNAFAPESDHHRRVLSDTAHTTRNPTAGALRHASTNPPASAGPNHVANPPDPPRRPTQTPLQHPPRIRRRQPRRQPPRPDRLRKTRPDPQRHHIEPEPMEIKPPQPLHPP